MRKPDEIFVVFFFDKGDIYVMSTVDGQVEGFNSVRDANNFLGFYKTKYESREIFACAAEIIACLTPTILEMSKSVLKLFMEFPNDLRYLKCVAVDTGYFGIRLSKDIEEVIPRSNFWAVETDRPGYTIEEFNKEAEIEVTEEIEVDI